MHTRAVATRSRAELASPSGPTDLAAQRPPLQVLDASRPWLIYWITHALDLMGAPLSDDEREQCVALGQGIHESVAFAGRATDSRAHTRAERGTYAGKRTRKGAPIAAAVTSPRSPVLTRALSHQASAASELPGHPAALSASRGGLWRRARSAAAFGAHVCRSQLPCHSRARCA